METKTRILIADASTDFSSLLGDLVAGEKDMEVVGVADNGEYCYIRRFEKA